MVKFILVRHGYSQANKEKKFTGQLDVPLDEIGIMQAKSVCKYIAENFEVDNIYSSDLCRAYDTIAELGKILNIPVEKCKELREVDVGLWQGRLIEDVKKEFPESFSKYAANPGVSRFNSGESYEDAMIRGKAFFDKVAKESDGKTVVIATHGGIIRTLRAALTNTPLENIKDIPHVANASITIVEYKDGNAVFTKIGSTDHLEDKTTEEGIKHQH